MTDSHSRRSVGKSALKVHIEDVDREAHLDIPSSTKGFHHHPRQFTLHDFRLVLPLGARYPFRQSQHYNAPCIINESKADERLLLGGLTERNQVRQLPTRNNRRRAEFRGFHNGSQELKRCKCPSGLA